MPSRQKCIELSLHNQTQTLSRALWLPYVYPFIVFIVLTIPASYFPEEIHLLYVLKTLAVGGLLWYWRGSYAMDIAPRLSTAGYLTAVAAGLLVLPAWILPEAFFPQLGAEAGFNPYSFGLPGAAVPALIAVRLIGAVLVVSVMEEVFWRSLCTALPGPPQLFKGAAGDIYLVSLYRRGCPFRRGAPPLAAGDVCRNC